MLCETLLHRMSDSLNVTSKHITAAENTYTVHTMEGTVLSTLTTYYVI